MLKEAAARNQGFLSGVSTQPSCSPLENRPGLAWAKGQMALKLLFWASDALSLRCHISPREYSGQICICLFLSALVRIINQQFWNTPEYLMLVNGTLSNMSGKLKCHVHESNKPVSYLDDDYQASSLFQYYTEKVTYLKITCLHVSTYNKTKILIYIFKNQSTPFLQSYFQSNI